MSHTSDGNMEPHRYNQSGLPANFLGIDQARLEVSASRTRSMADLQRGLGLMDRVFGISDILVNAYEMPYENFTSGRHIRRGAALARLLLEESAPGLSLDLTSFQESLTRIIPKEDYARDRFSDVLNGLTFARQQAMTDEDDTTSAEDIEVYQAEFAAQTDSILEAAGFSNEFNIALGNLTGEGLEEPTLTAEARYGAALVATAFGLINGIEVS